MKAMRYALILVAALSAAPVLAQTKPAAAQPADSMQILREKLKGDKKLIVAANLDLSEAEAKKFWPLYEKYQQELYKINDSIALLIVAYAKEYNAAALRTPRRPSCSTRASRSRKPRPGSSDLSYPSWPRCCPGARSRAICSSKTRCARS